MLSRQQMADRSESRRQAFVEAARAAGFAHEHVAHPLSGPTGLPIGTDVARGGRADAEDVVVVSSGTHGIEGHIGSELQTRLLREGRVDALLERARVMFVHAINPYGFAWHRRVNEDNVDLNRNFVDFDQPLPVNEGYEEFNALLNPEVWSDEHVQVVETAAREALGRLGPYQLFRSVSGGQYAYPHGMQFGGQRPTWSRTMIERLWTAEVTGARRAVMVDLHTGLGPRGHGDIGTHGTADAARTEYAKQMWPDVSMSVPTADGTVWAFGPMNPLLESLTPGTVAVCAGLEFGTLAGNRVSRAMAADNWLHRHGDIDSPQGQQIKQDILDAFYVDADDWRDAVWARTCEVLDGVARA